MEPAGAPNQRNDSTGKTLPANPERSWSKEILARLPLPLLRAAGGAVGMIWYAGHRTHRNTVKRNLAFAFPEWTRSRVRQTTRQVFRHFGLIIFENLQLSVLTCPEVMGRCRIEGVEHLERALSLNRGVFMVSAHTGNWEIGFQMMTCYFNRPFMSVAKKFKNELLDQWIYRLRHRLGSTVLYKKGAMAGMSKALKRGDVAGVHIDMSRQDDGIDVDFFARKATATPAAALAALRHKSPVVPATFIRDPDGKIMVRIGEPILMERTKSLRDDIQTLTQIMTDYVEQAIRNNPVQWWWLQKRWKDYYPGLYPEHLRRQAQRLRHRLDRKKKRMMRN